MKNAKAIFLDLDNTLLDGNTQQGAVFATCREISNVQPVLTADLLVKSNSEVWSRLWPEVADKWMHGKIDNNWLCREAWRQTLENINSYDESLLQLAVQTYEKAETDSYCLFDDVHGFIDSIKQTGNSRDNVWHIGDSFNADIIGAKAAGINAVWINRTGKVLPESNSYKPDLIVQSLSEIVDFYDQ